MLREAVGAWTWVGCCNSGCCGLLELELDAAIQDVVGCLNLSWMLQFRILWVAWTWVGCCNSGCCGLLELELDAAIQDVVGCLNLSWMLQFKMLRVLLLGVHLSYIFNFCTFTTSSSFANVGLGFVFHIHFQSSNIYILRFLHFAIQFWFFFHCLGIYFWNLLLELESDFGIFCWVWISNSRDFEIFI
jgi:hypothetical protein